MNRKKWDSLFKDESQKKKILEVIQIIGEDLSHTVKSPDLFDGKAGVGIFWEYFYIITGNIVYRKNSIDCINASLKEIESTPLSYKFSSGISGILWSYNHLIELNGSIENIIIGDEIIDFIVERAILDLKNGNYDYLHGGLGPLVYLLSNIKKNTREEKIIDIINVLKDISETADAGITWQDGLYFLKEKRKRYNLGLAHGIPSVIVLLSKVIKAGIDVTENKKLLTSVVNWVLGKKQNMEAGTFFPIFIPNSIFEFSRISWCYGDLGIVIAILQAGIITQNKFWIEESLKIGIQISKRKDKIGIQDACLCHGTAGNGHIFNRLYQYSEIEEFKNASIFWYAETLKFHELYGHFKFYTNDIDNQWKKEQGILEGSAGIGLALISAISHIEPKWDRSLLLS